MIFSLCQISWSLTVTCFHRWCWVSLRTTDTIAVLLIFSRYPQLFMPAFSSIHVKSGSLISYCLTFFGLERGLSFWRWVELTWGDCWAWDAIELWRLRVLWGLRPDIVKQMLEFGLYVHLEESGKQHPKLVYSNNVHSLHSFWQLACALNWFILDTILHIGVKVKTF